MPLPIIHQSAETQLINERRCKIFVSYSHKDMDDAEKFIEFFDLQLRGTQELDITREHIFFDCHKLKAGDVWDDSIQQALDEAKYFILLVSANSLSSSYCFSRELATAVARALPILPILLKPCPWEHNPSPRRCSQTKIRRTRCFTQRRSVQAPFHSKMAKWSR
jgi:hypothetical protein